MAWALGNAYADFGGATLVGAAIACGVVLAVALQYGSFDSPLVAWGIVGVLWLALMLFVHARSPFISIGLGVLSGAGYAVCTATVWHEAGRASIASRNKWVLLNVLASAGAYLLGLLLTNVDLVRSQRLMFEFAAVAGPLLGLYMARRSVLPLLAVILLCSLLIASGFIAVAGAVAGQPHPLARITLPIQAISLLLLTLAYRDVGHRSFPEEK